MLHFVGTYFACLFEGRFLSETANSWKAAPQPRRMAVRTEEALEMATDACKRSIDSARSLRVPNVQALVATAAASPDDLIGETLERYTRPELQNETVRGADASGDVPVVDLGRLLDPQLSQEEASKLKFACEDWGFFQLVNHGISNEVIEKMKVVTQEFFQLPLKEKEAFAQQPGGVEGYGQMFVVSEDQKLDWADMLLLQTQPLSNRNMKLWPTHPSSIRDTLDRYSLELKKIVHTLIELIAKNLGADPKKLDNMFGTQFVKLNYYPPCPHADKVLGVSPHSDSGILTLLLQINEVQGLQIKKDGEWLPIKPLPGAFIANIGDSLEVLSNGKYKSIEHRVVINPEKERLSIAAFHNLKHDSVVGPLPELVNGAEVYYKTMSSNDFMKLFYSKKLDGKGHINVMKLKT